MSQKVMITKWFQVLLIFLKKSKIKKTEWKQPKGIAEFVRHGDEVAEFYKEIENCLEKVAIRYDIETHFEYQWPPEGYITIIFVLDGTYENEDEE